MLQLSSSCMDSTILDHDSHYMLHYALIDCSNTPSLIHSYSSAYTYVHVLTMEANATVLAEADEMVIAQELQLKSLSKRKALLIKQRQGMEHNLGKHRLELTWFQSNKATLKAAQLKHVKLQREIELKLCKSEERWKQFPTHVVEQIANETDPINSSDDLNEITKGVVENNIIDNLPVETETLRQNENDDDDDNVADPTASPNARTDSALQLKESLVSMDEDPSKLIASVENPFAGKNAVLSLFQIQQNTSSSSYLVLHLMVHGQRLENMMELSTQDLLSIDDDEGRQGIYRREALYHTCLLPFPVVPWEHHHDHGNNRDRNNDPDPDYPSCPYELTGDCRDPFCMFAHFQERKVESQRLVKEMIPLPDFALVGFLGSSSSRHRKRRDRVEDKGNHMLRKKLKGLDDVPIDNDQVKTAAPFNESSTNSSTNEKTSSDDEPSADFLESSHAFVPMPKGDPDSGEEEKDDGPPESWWMDDDDRMRIRDVWAVGNQVSLLTWVRTVYGLAQHDDFLVCQTPCQNLDEQALLRLLGRLVSALQLFIHSGRYDFAGSSCRMLETLCLNYIEIFPCDQLHAFFASWGQSWKINNHQQNIFAVALARQTLLFSINHFLSLLDRHKNVCLISGHANDSEYSATWADLLARIIATSSSHPTTRSRLKCTQALKDSKDEKRVSRASTTDMMELTEFVALTERTLAGQSLSLNEVNCLLEKYRTNIKQQERDGGAVLRSIAQIGSLATGIEQALGEVGVSAKEISRLEYKLDRLSTSIQEESDLPKTDLRFLLTPILALRVSLIISTRRYDKAQRALEGYLDSHLCVSSFSDLLWSQMIMLRSMLPTRQVARNSNDTESQRISTVVSSLGLKLNVLTLVGDRALFHPFRKARMGKKKRIELQANVSMFMHKIQMHEGVGSPLVEMLDLEAIPFGSSARDPGTRDSLSRLLFPRSLLLGGYSLRRLKLTDCQIEVLPQLFGEYFPTLQVSTKCCVKQ